MAAMAVCDCMSIGSTMNVIAYNISRSQIQHAMCLYGASTVLCYKTLYIIPKVWRLLISHIGNCDDARAQTPTE